MSPTLVAHNAMYLLKYHAILVGDRRLAHSFSMQAANFENIILGQLCHAMSISALLSFFCYHVVNVVSLSTKKQMIRIAAWRIVAFVETVKPIWNGTKVKFIRDAMRKACFPTMTDFAIAKGMLCARPKPTFIPSARLDVFPESNLKGRSASMMRDKRERLTFDNSKTVVGAFRYGYFGLATALTKAVWLAQAALRDPGGIIGYVVGKVWGMITHGIVSFKDCAERVASARQRLATFYCTFCHSIIPHLQGLVE